MTLKQEPIAKMIWRTRKDWNCCKYGLEYCWKKHLKISKVVRFEICIFQNSEDIVPKMRGILQTSLYKHL